MSKTIPIEEVEKYINSSETWDDMRKWTKEDWRYFKAYMAHNGITGWDAFKVIRRLKKLSKQVVEV